MRSGVEAPATDDAGTRQFKAHSQRLMGDMNDAGDAPFGGELQLNPQVSNTVYASQHPQTKTPAFTTASFCGVQGPANFKTQLGMSFM